VTVIKRSQEHELFNRSKLLRGIVRACEKTPVSSQVMEAIVDDIEAELQQRHHREVTSAEIGEMVLAKLRTVNEVAFVRFASVYRQFQGIRDFADTLNQLRDGHLKDEHPDEGLDAAEPQGNGRLPAYSVPTLAP
jgi:transcriptional repressor NrdR